MKMHFELWTCKIFQQIYVSVNEFEGLFLKTGQGSFEPVFKSLESLIHTYDDDEMRFISRPFITRKKSHFTQG